MKDEPKTKEQLIAELVELRQRVAELEVSEAELGQAEAERERLLAAEREQRLQAETLREVAGALNTSLDRERVLQLILEQLARVVDYDSTSVMLVSDNELEIVAYRGFRSEGQRFARLQIRVLPHAQEVIENHAPVIIPDTTADSRWVHRPESEYIRCWLGVPLVVQDRAIGLLSLDKEQPGSYTQRDADLVVAFANQAAVAIENARLFEAVGQELIERKRAEETLEQRAGQLALLNDIGEKIAAVLELDSVLDRAVRLVQESFGYHHVALFTVDSEEGELVMRVRAGSFVSLYPPDHRLKLGQGMVGSAGLHGEKLLANDVSAEPRYINLYPDVIPTQSELSVPIRVGEEIVGVLDVQSPQLNAFDENDVMVMETLADQIAVAIENARLYEALRERTEALERSNRELEQFAYIASHDLQEPLRMVASYLQLLARRYEGKLDADADEFIAFAVDGAIRMQTLINDLLAYSRVGTRGKDFEPADCEAVLDRALANLQMAIAEGDATVTRDPLPTVMADGGQLVQLFQNLIGNAIKFHGQEPPRVHISVERRGGEWTFSVRDNGIGIKPEYTERIFGIFQRLHSRAEYPGTGIGLAVCNKIVERHGGRIWVESQPGEGSTFHFTLKSEA